MTDVTLEVPAERKSLVLANFTNGKIDSKRCDKLSVCHLTSSQRGPGGKRKKQLLVVETEQMAYTGQNFGVSADRSQHFCKYFVGIRDRGKMTICDTQIFSMLPKIQGDEEESQKDDASKSYLEKNDYLTEAFGSKKKQKAMENRLRSKSAAKSIETIMDSAATQAITQLSHISRAQAEDQTDSSIPPCNKEASSPEDVYGLHDIISEREMEALTTPASVFYNSTFEQISQWKEQNEYPLYITNHLMSLPLSETERWEKSKCLLYLHYLITFNSINVRVLTQKAPLPEEWPGVVRTQLLNRFTMKLDTEGRSRRYRPARLKDKTISYILVLCLIIDEFKVDVTDLIKDLKLSLIRMQNHFRALGCTLSTKKTAGEQFTVSASLNLPLSFPDPSARSKKGRR
ncbi:DNA-directed RNA polymerase I subunit RPA49-like [Argopecten irradians]|uniref:DNA-directed RNA polymerase I subunit RPA49-like n=1 Tax=Argopecten irradians TaxID=31199 RepID=UPI00370FB429